MGNESWTGNVGELEKPKEKKKLKRYEKKKEDELE